MLCAHWFDFLIDDSHPWAYLTVIGARFVNNSRPYRTLRHRMILMLYQLLRTLIRQVKCLLENIFVCNLLQTTKISLKQTQLSIVLAPGDHSCGVDISGNRETSYFENVREYQ